jgi:hypothetical protein
MSPGDRKFFKISFLETILLGLGNFVAFRVKNSSSRMTVDLLLLVIEPL